MPGPANLKAKPTAAPSAAPNAVTQPQPSVSTTNLKPKPSSSATVTPDSSKSGGPAQSQTNAGSYAKSNSIATMQQAINNLHLDLQSKLETKSDISGIESTTPFLQWIVDKYMSTSKGKSLLQTDVSAKDRENVLKSGPKNLGQAASVTSAPNSFFKNFLDSIKNIGASSSIKSEGKPDGVWGPRTQNSLKLVNTFYQMMIQLETSLGEKVNWKPQFLGKVASWKNPPSGPLEKINAAAENLAEEIESIRNVFDQFYQNVFEKYSEFTSSKKPFLTINPQEKFDQSATQQTIESWFKSKDKTNGQQNYNFFLQNVNRPLPIEVPQNLSDGSGKKFTITLNDLSHTKSFVDFVTNNQLILNNKLITKETMPQALKIIENLLANAKPIADKTKSGVPIATKWE